MNTRKILIGLALYDDGGVSLYWGDTDKRDVLERELREDYSRATQYRIAEVTIPDLRPCGDEGETNLFGEVV